MRAIVFILFAAAAAPAVAANASDVTLQYYLDRSELAIVAEFLDDPSASSDEFGVVNCSCQVKLLSVIQGKLADKQLHVEIVRSGFERSPLLKQGTRCILFLKTVPMSNPPWHTADFWFGLQPYDATMAAGVARLAVAKPSPSSITGSRSRQ